MRSFRLLILFLLLGFVSSGYANQEAIQSKSLFMVTFPYDEGQSVEQTLDDAMALLLVRLTGKKTFLTSRVAQAYLKNPKAWLKTYDITPRLEDGVTIGKNIVYTFDEAKLHKEFHQRFVPIWPLSLRPKTLVVGALVQGGDFIKLDQNTLQYRLDADFRTYPQKIQLPMSLPVAPFKSYLMDWHLSADTVKTRSAVQAILAKSNLPFLLSFQVVMNGLQTNHLTWALYNSMGEQVLVGKEQGRVILALTNQMFDQVATYYVEHYKSSLQQQEKETEKQSILLNIHKIGRLDQALLFERLLKEQPEMIGSVTLVSMQAEQVQYRITPQMSYQAILNWIQRWPQSVLVGSFPEQKIIELDVNSEFFAKSNKETP
ncbi:hypothetical protein MNBD_GAMMA04-1704 [hydrothermal vent metagenome]|uniref:DUF2066 domain-containing protein n=1 Tax=hydrothermal vent metagenome TaxID=652676 RepID=A0A3B0W953_9ZZZZ